MPNAPYSNRWHQLKRNIWQLSSYEIRMERIARVIIFGLIIFLILSISSLELIAQEISYYDQDWNPTTEDKVQYYFVTIDYYPKYRLNRLVNNGKRFEKHVKKSTKKVRKEIGTKEINEINFQDSDYDSIYIGKTAKIFSVGDIYG